jgi:hypothetical protein
MTRIFYSRYVPGDPLLGPLFAEMSPDHPERVAAWLSEVFGGSPLYTERCRLPAHGVAAYWSSRRCFLSRTARVFYRAPRSSLPPRVRRHADAQPNSLSRRATVGEGIRNRGRRRGPVCVHLIRACGGPRQHLSSASGLGAHACRGWPLMPAIAPPPAEVSRSPRTSPRRSACSVPSLPSSAVPRLGSDPCGMVVPRSNSYQATFRWSWS